MASDTDWRPAWRVELIPSYKAHRTAEPVPPDLEPQMALIHSILAAVGIEFVGMAEYEAEDVIASWTALVQGTVEIVSGDRDLFALVEDPRVRVVYPEKGGLALVTEEEVTRRYGIPGRSYADYAILRGDPSDGLPGLKGVGSVAAARYIHTHGGVAGLLEGGRLSESQRDYLVRALRVVPPVADLPVDEPRGRRRTYPADPAVLEALGREHGVTSSAARLVEALNGGPASG